MEWIVSVRARCVLKKSEREEKKKCVLVVTNYFKIKRSGEFEIDVMFKYIEIGNVIDN